MPALCSLRFAFAFRSSFLVDALTSPLRASLFVGGYAPTLFFGYRLARPLRPSVSPRSSFATLIVSGCYPIFAR